MSCTKFGEVPVEERGKGVMTNEEAILRLARDSDDEPALIAIAENNENTLKAAIGRYFSGRTTCKRALNTLLIRMSQRAKSPRCEPLDSTLCQPGIQAVA